MLAHVIVESASLIHVLSFPVDGLIGMLNIPQTEHGPKALHKVVFWPKGLHI